MELFTSALATRLALVPVPEQLVADPRVQVLALLQPPVHHLAT